MVGGGRRRSFCFRLVRILLALLQIGRPMRRRTFALRPARRLRLGVASVPLRLHRIGVPSHVLRSFFDILVFALLACAGARFGVAAA